MREPRPRKPDDNQNLDKAVDLIYELIALNKQIESTLWVGAIIFVLFEGYKEAGYKFEEFKLEMEDVFDRYKEFYES